MLPRIGLRMPRSARKQTIPLSRALTFNDIGRCALWTWPFAHPKLETTALYARVATNTIREVMSPLDRLTPLRPKKDEPETRPSRTDNEIKVEPPAWRAALLARSRPEVAISFAAIGQAWRQANAAHVSLGQLKVTVDHITYYTPLQDYVGIITPASLHFVQYHASHFPDIDAQQHRLTIHGMVDRPLSFSMEDLKRLPSVSRIHFLECHGNSSPMIHGTGNQNMGPPVQYIHGMTSCSEWTGVPLSVLLNEVGVQTAGTWLVSEGADPGKAEAKPSRSLYGT
jgi:hypothetical protein